jgi:hypothetical protein
MNVDLLLRRKENHIGPVCTPLLHPISSFDFVSPKATTITGEDSSKMLGDAAQLFGIYPIRHNNSL